MRLIDADELIKDIIETNEDVQYFVANEMRKIIGAINNQPTIKALICDNNDKPINPV